MFNYFLNISYAMIRDVNKAGRVRVIALPYPIRWTKIRLIPVSISVWVSVVWIHVSNYNFK